MTAPNPAAPGVAPAASDPIPKAELHLHVEGTLEPELAFELARRNGIELPYPSVDALRSRYAFSDLQSFLDLYYQCMTVLRTRRDFADLGTAYFERAAAQGVRHVEMFFDPQVHRSNGAQVDDVMDGLLDAFDDAQRRFEISGGLILCFLRDRPPAEATAILDSVAGRAGDLIGVGLDSAEVGYPPSLFSTVFDAARSLGLHLVAHAGEEGPPEYIVEALDLLHVERVDHGIRAVESPELLARLRGSGVPLTVCPLSNVRLHAVDSLADHPLTQLIDAGVTVTVNSDDPAYFGGYIGDNFDAVRDEFALDDDALAALARNSVLASFASSERKDALMREIEQHRRRASVH